MDLTKLPLLLEPSDSQAKRYLNTVSCIYLWAVWTRIG